MAPADLTGLVIDGLEDSLAPNPAVRARPAVDAIGGLGKINAPTGVSVHDKQSVPGVKAGGAVVRHAGFVGRNEASIGRRLFGGIGNRAALRIDAQRPVHGPEWRGQETLAVGAVKHKEVAVA